MRIDNPKRIVTDPVVSFPNLSSPSSVYSPSPPQTPTRAPRPSINSLSSSVTDIFNTENLHTAKEINAAIAATQMEATRLLEAFKQLESTTVHRIQLQTAQRPRPATSPSSPLSPNRKPYRRIPPPLNLSDKASVDSRSTARTSLSHSKSASSLRSRLHPPSPLSPFFSPPIHSAYSVSSLASQVPSHGRMGMSSSTSRIMLTDSEEAQSSDGIGNGVEEGLSSHADILEVQQRRNEVMARCEARLKYLRAKLKGAELHEKLLRK
jgi:hypothetical protein